MGKTNWAKDRLSHFLHDFVILKHKFVLAIINTYFNSLDIHQL